MSIRDELEAIILKHFEPGGYPGTSWRLNPGAAAEEILERFPLAEEWGVLDEEEGGFTYDGPTAEQEARASMEKYPNDHDTLFRRYATPWEPQS